MAPSLRLHVAVVCGLLIGMAWVSLACNGKQGPAGPPGSPVTVVYVSGTPSYLTQWGQYGNYSSAPTIGAGYFYSPYGVAVDALGYVYVADTNNHRIQKFTSSGVPVTMWGQYGDYSSTPASGAGYFNYPYGVAVDTLGNVYVADTNNHRIQIFNPNGAPIAMWGQYGNYSSAPTIGAGYFNYPSVVAVDASGNVYVADTNNDRIQKFNSSGVPVTMWGQYGDYSSTPASGAGYFHFPQGVAVDASGNVYVADTNNDRIQKFNSNGVPVTMWGQFGNYQSNPASGAGYFYYPYELAVDASGNVYVADAGNYRIQKFNSSGTFVTMWGVFGATSGKFNVPNGVAVDASGYIYVADTNNYRIQVFAP